MLPPFVICGVEHSGTTTVSDVFRQVPGYDSGFEVGVLLRATPKEFRALEPFISNMKAGWGLTDPDLDYMCDAATHAEFYDRLVERATSIDKAARIFDKTPRYFSELRACMQRVDVPFVVTYKDPRALAFSDYKRSAPKDFEQWLETYKGPKLRYLKGLYETMHSVQADPVFGPRAVFVSMEDLCLNTAHSLKRIFAHVDVPFSFKYLFLENLRFKNTKGNFIDSRMPFHYLNGFTPAQIGRIEQEFGILKEWFYS